jgi:NAD(P)-dependent dehydrogenase (short-subunit alcohol dehydrogenase family)
MEKGVHVAVTGRNEETAQTAATKLNDNSNTGAKAIGVEADVRSLASQESAMRATMSEFGKIDVVIANAGIGHFGNVESLTSAQWQETIDTNLTGAFYTLKANLDALKESKGYYITISSLAGTNFFAGGSAYNASKFGLTGFTQAAMLDLRKHGIKVSTIMPGSVATYFNDHIPNDQDSWKIQIEDIGKLVVDLLEMHPRTLPSKIEVRPSIPPSAMK